MSLQKVSPLVPESEPHKISIALTSRLCKNCCWCSSAYRCAERLKSSGIFMKHSSVSGSSVEQSRYWYPPPSETTDAARVELKECRVAILTVLTHGCIACPKPRPLLSPPSKPSFHSLGLVEVEIQNRPSWLSVLCSRQSLHQLEFACTFHQLARRRLRRGLTLELQTTLQTTIRGHRIRNPAAAHGLT